MPPTSAVYTVRNVIVFEKVLNPTWTNVFHDDFVKFCQVNRCDLASAKLGLKAMGQENNRLLSKARGQANRIRELEVLAVRSKRVKELRVR